MSHNQPNSPIDLDGEEKPQKSTSSQPQNTGTGVFSTSMFPKLAQIMGKKFNQSQPDEAINVDAYVSNSEEKVPQRVE